MGGNALSKPSVRLDAGVYQNVAEGVVEALRRAFPDRAVEIIPAYAEKPDFGDLDVLVAGGQGYSPATAYEALEGVEMVRNGDVTSIGVSTEAGIFQVDVIKVPADSFEFSLRYFSFNDLGNLIGRIAHKFGFKFGHLGLLYPIRDPENPSYLLRDVLVTADFYEALEIIGYSAQGYRDALSGGGFRTLEDIFQYAVSSPYSNPDIYLLENRSSIARKRDQKRPTYNAFLEWLRTAPQETVERFPWTDSTSAERKTLRAEFLNKCRATFPAFDQEYQSGLRQIAENKQMKQFFNGEFVRRVTGKDGNDLGQLMTAAKKAFPDEAAFRSFFLTTDEEGARQFFEQLVAS